MDDLIDMIEGNRRYVRCLYVYNKVDMCRCARAGGALAEGVCSAGRRGAASRMLEACYRHTTQPAGTTCRACRRKPPHIFTPPHTHTHAHTHPHPQH